MEKVFMHSHTVAVPATSTKLNVVTLPFHSVNVCWPIRPPWPPLSAHAYVTLFPSSLMLSLMNVHHDTLMKRQRCGASRGEGYPVPHVSLCVGKLCYSDHCLPRCHWGFQILQMWSYTKILVMNVLQNIFGYIFCKNVQPVLLCWAWILFTFLSAVHLDPLHPFTFSYIAVIIFSPSSSSSSSGRLS